MNEANPFTLVGTILIVLGILFVALPYLSRNFNVNSIPWIILWIYKNDNFTFATSPILIFISLIYLVLVYIRR